MKIFLMSHGSFSKGLFETLEMIYGKQEDIYYLGLYPEQSVETLEKDFEDNLKSIGNDEEILVLTDLFFGSPFNVVVRFMKKYNIYHLTGISLPLLMEIVLMRSNNVCAEDICKRAIELSKNSLIDVRVQLADVLYEEREGD